MHDSRCTCSAHDPDGDVERAIRAGIRANRAKLWKILGPGTRAAHAADGLILDRLALESRML
jgi:hypothetical protein